MRARLVLALGLMVSLCATARAQDRTFSTQLWHPAPGPDEFVTVEALESALDVAMTLVECSGSR